LSLLAGCLPNTKRTVIFDESENTQERSELIKRILEDDMQQFKLKVYFNASYEYGDRIPLLEWQDATEDSLHYYVPPPPRIMRGFGALAN